jgi:hypothetical protein
MAAAPPDPHAAVRGSDLRALHSEHGGWMWWIAALLGCTPESPPTFYADVAPVLGARCGACHTSDGVAFSLDDPEIAAALADDLITLARGRTDAAPYRMPPFAAVETEACAPPAPWKDDPRVTDGELAVLVAWRDAGALPGDPDDLVPVESPSLDLVGANATLTAPDHLVAAYDGEDPYVCFPLDPGLSETRWLTGVQVLPGDDRVVHHASVLLDPGRASAALAGSDGSFPCFATPGAVGSDSVANFAPGAPPSELPDDAGFAVSPGDGLVLLVHYHGITEDVVDRTQVALRYVDAPPAHTARFTLNGVIDLDVLPRTVDPPLLVPAGATDHAEEVRVPLVLPDGARIWSVFPHMHYSGVTQQVFVDHGAHGGDDTCLIEVGRWDFDWQRDYVYDAPLDALPEVHPGDELVVRCTFDNTVDNPSVVTLLDDLGVSEPFELASGNASTDEMCVALVGLLFP